jgi:hypothetical protein
MRMRNIQMLEESRNMESHSNFVRISIYVLAVFIAGLVLAGFLLGEPKYQLSAEIITLVLIILILFLSESFNNLSIGKILTLSKENKVTKNENSGLKNENTELRNQLINVATNVSQSQVTYNGLSPELLKALNVVPARESDKEAKGKIEEESTDESPARPLAHDSPPQTELQKLMPNGSSRMRLMRTLEPDAIADFCKTIGINTDEVQHEVRFASAFEGLDPIMESSVVFDAYYQLEERELFFEVIRSDMLRPDRMYYLYQMLTKLFLYRKAKSSNAELILIVIELPESVRSRFSSHDRGQERLSSQFAPAVANKLLRIEKIKYEEDELIEFIKNSSNKRVN